MRISPIILLAICILGGCGYRIGNMAPADMKRIAISKVGNVTNEPRMSVFAASKLRAAFVTDGSVMLVEQPQADYVLHSKVAKYTLGSAGSAKLTSNDKNQQIYSTNIWRVTVHVEYRLQKNGEAPGTPRTVTGVAEFSDLIDLNVVRRDGIRQALADASSKIVSEVTGGSW